MMRLSSFEILPEDCNRLKNILVCVLKVNIAHVILPCFFEYLCTLPNETDYRIVDQHSMLTAPYILGQTTFFGALPTSAFGEKTTVDRGFVRDPVGRGDHLA